MNRGINEFFVFRLNIMMDYTCTISFMTAKLLSYMRIRYIILIMQYGHANNITSEIKRVTIAKYMI